jgi:hypothetical protein
MKYRRCSTNWALGLRAADWAVHNFLRTQSLIWPFITTLILKRRLPAFMVPRLRDHDGLDPAPG